MTDDFINNLDNKLETLDRMMECHITISFQVNIRDLEIQIEDMIKYLKQYINYLNKTQQSDEIKSKLITIQSDIRNKMFKYKKIIPQPTDSPANFFEHYVKTITLYLSAKLNELDKLKLELKKISKQ